MTDPAASLPTVCLLGSMEHTPFASVEALAAGGLAPVATEDEAEFLLAKSRKPFRTRTANPKQKHLVWTHEPFVDKAQGPVDMRFLKTGKKRTPLYLFNVHNGLVYTDNFYYAPGSGALPLLTSEAELNVGFDDKTVTMSATAKTLSLMVGARDISLCLERLDLALALWRMGMARIIGRGWPDGVSLEDSRGSDRVQAKARFLRSSNFNLAYENSAIDFYVTEKIWEPIAHGCLPIYRGSPTITQTFPEHSFIDGAAFATPEALADFVRAMSFDEFRARVNRCREVYNHVAARRLKAASRARAISRFASVVAALARPGGAQRRDAGLDDQAQQISA